MWRSQKEKARKYEKREEASSSSLDSDSKWLLASQVETSSNCDKTLLSDYSNKCSYNILAKTQLKIEFLSETILMLVPLSDPRNKIKN